MEEKEAEERIEYLLNKGGMSKADMDKFPYEFSGGQRQRIGIARAHKRIQLKGELPSPMNIPEGCRFVTRCPYATEACKNGVPKLQEISKGHSVACHRAKEIL